MIDEAVLLNKLRTTRVALADAALNLQTVGTEAAAFRFGHASGMNQGLRVSEQLLLEMLKDNEREL